jgi:hypothetical protein
MVFTILFDLLNNLELVSYHISKDKAKVGEFPSDMAQVEPFVVFSWLLTDSQQKKARQWTEAILANSGIMVAASSSAQAGSSGHKAKKAKTTHTEAFVDGLFE